MNSIAEQTKLRFNRLTTELLDCPRHNAKRFNKLNRERSRELAKLRSLGISVSHLERV
jgi:hypothetical protein